MKYRPAVVLSTADYHACRPDLIVGLLTTQIARAVTPMDHVLLDWAAAGLNAPTAFRSYLLTMANNPSLPCIGRLSDRDWQAVRDCVRKALAVT